MIIERYFPQRDAVQKAVETLTEYYKTRSQNDNRNNNSNEKKKKQALAFGPSVAVSCTNLTKFKGGSICLPHTESTAMLVKQPPCHILKSGGGSDNWEWEQTLLDTLGTSYGSQCQAHKADCTLSSSQVISKKPSEDYHYYNHCLSDHFHVDHQGHYHVLYSDWLELAQVEAEARPLLMKMEAHKHSHGKDTSTSSTSTTLQSTLAAMVQQDQRVLGMELTSSLPLQLLIDVPPDPDLAQVLFTQGGYIPIAQKPSLKCPTCYQVLFFQVMC
jgi:hypothetical protein